MRIISWNALGEKKLRNILQGIKIMSSACEEVSGKRMNVIRKNCPKQ